METPLSWYPGHMAKARRQIEAGLKMVDAIIEVADSRAPFSSRNPDLLTMVARRPRLLVTTKSDLADPAVTQQWRNHWTNHGEAAIAVNLLQPRSGQLIAQRVNDLPRKRTRGARRVMVVGTPNVGKSTLINALIGRGAARTGAKPGVTRGQQWLNTTVGIQLLDTPGLMWPRLQTIQIGLKLAWIGSIGDKAYSAEQVAQDLLLFLQQKYPDKLADRYGDIGSADVPLLSAVAHRRGMLLKGGVTDDERAAHAVLADFRHGRLGQISLEAPGDVKTDDDDG